MVFTIYGHGGHLGHVTRTIWTNFNSRILRSLHMKFEFNWPSGFRGEDVWKCWRTDEGGTGILLAHPWAFGSGELKYFSKTHSYLEACNPFDLNALRSQHWVALGDIGQSVMGLAADACRTPDPGVASSIPTRFHTFVEIQRLIMK